MASVAPVRIIKPSFLTAAVLRHPGAEPGLQAWKTIVQNAEWNHFAELRTTFASADQVKVGSGRTVIIFNIGGNHFRLITAIHYNRRRLYTLRFLTHAKYSKNHWKTEL